MGDGILYALLLLFSYSTIYHVGEVYLDLSQILMPGWFLYFILLQV